MSSKSSNTNDWPSRCTVDRVSNELLSQSRGESSVCSACNGYYGQANGQPVCLTCHAFLYASGFDAENVNLQLMSEERDDENDSDRDSGNEEPNELFYVATGGPVPIPSDAKSPTSRNTDSDDFQQQQARRESHSEDIFANAGLAASNPRYDNPVEAQQIIDPVAVVNREQDEVGPVDRAINPFHAMLEDDVESWNLEMALAPVSSFSGEGDRSAGASANDNQSSTHRRHHMHHVKLDTLKERIALLSMPAEYESNLNSNLPNEMVQALPNEVLMLIFSFLDDISLYAVGNVCRRWHQLLVSQTTSEQWKTYTRRRWPLYKPLCPVSDWFAIYSFLAKSTCCLTCLRDESRAGPYVKLQTAYPGSLFMRRRRLKHELATCNSDSYEGFEVLPIGESLYHWKASIRGPRDSPYEGGIFYLHIRVPFNYPFEPPEMYFVTKILHPNISRHGDIGVDILQGKGWSPSMTLQMLLLSIQSILTDPYTEICMEPEIGKMYNENRKLFDSVARKWTWQFAMDDFLI